MLKRISLTLFVLSCYLVIRWLVPDELDSNPSLPEAEFNSDYQMENVTSSHFNEQGLKSFSLDAVRINYSNQYQHSEFIEPRVVVTSKDTVITLESPVAYSENLTTLTFPEQVLISSQHTTQQAITQIQTSKLVADFNKKSIETNESIAITSISENSRSSLNGTGLTMDLMENIIEIKSNLRSQLEIKPQDNDNN